MSAVLYVGNTPESRALLKVMHNMRSYNNELVKVKIDMRKEKPVLVFKQQKIKDMAKILSFIKPSQPVRRPQMRQPPVNHDFEDQTYRSIYSEDSKTPTKDFDDEIDDEINSKKKQQREDQYRRHQDRLSQAQVPKRVPVEARDEQPEYEEGIEEKKENELNDYYNYIMNSAGD